MRMGANIVTAGIAAAILTLLTGCGSGGNIPLSFPAKKTSATTAPATSATSAASPSSAPRHAPHVTNPLDITRFDHDPCATLTPTQLQSLGVDPAGDQEAFGTNKTDMTCTWTDSAQTERVQVDMSNDDVGDDAGLGYIYGRQDEHWSSFQPTRIDGYPAVIAELPASGSPNNACEAFVGFSDDRAISIFVAVAPANPGFSAACSVAAQWATDAATTMASGV